MQEPAGRIEGPRVRLVRLGPEHGEPLTRIRQQPEVVRWWGDVGPEGALAEDADCVRFAVLLRDRGDAVHGMVQYCEDDTPGYRHAGIDLYLDPAVHGRGLGREVVAVVAAHLVDERGHERLVIDPAAGNARAIACYTAVGFRPVGVMRRYERLPDGTVHDGLLMDLLPEELVRATPPPPASAGLTPP